uniref:(California timema) hypothetical protein n=1 Tax=Timema californicum TaxID=61474 RepID=A0A7R9JAZ6_TIMCA|nr:unnamed protein product [Timema californicum]
MTPSLDVNHRDNDVNCPVFKRKIDVQRIPGQVNLLRAIKVTTSSIQITWNSPLENEACLKAYQICWDSNGTNCETIPDNNSTGFTIDNLVACTTYNISVAALGISGSSENVTFTNTTAPNPVRSVSQSKKTTQYVILNWKPPDRGNECLESFAIYVCDHTKNIVNEKLIAIIPGSITMFNYTGLEACAGVLVNIKTMDQHKSTSDLGSGQFYLQAGGEGVILVKDRTADNMEIGVQINWKVFFEQKYIENKDLNMKAKDTADEKCKEINSLVPNMPLSLSLERWSRKKYSFLPWDQLLLQHEHPVRKDVYLNSCLSELYSQSKFLPEENIWVVSLVKSSLKFFKLKVAECCPEV